MAPTKVREVSAQSMARGCSAARTSAIANEFYGFGACDIVCFRHGERPTVLYDSLSNECVYADSRQVPNQLVQTTIVCCATLLSISMQSALRPFRRASDNDVALLAQWLVFAWTFVLLLRIAGMFEREVAAMFIGVVLCLASVTVLVAALWLANADRLNEQRAEEQSSTLSSDPAGQATESPDDAEIELVTLGDGTTESTEQQAAHAPRQPEARGRASPREDDEVKVEDVNPPPPASSLPWSLIVGNSALCGGSESAEDDATPTATT